MGIRSFTDKWRYYGVGREEYKKCIQYSFSDNLYSLQKANIVVAILAIIYTVFRFFINRNDYLTIGVYFGTGFIAIIQIIIVRYKIILQKKGTQASWLFIYTLIIVYFLNIILFGIYIGVWENPGRIAGSFLGILICALFLFEVPAVFSLCLTLFAMSFFMAISILIKAPNVWIIDCSNAVFSGFIAIYFGWLIINSRMSKVSLSIKLEDERNNYYNQSTIDELTQLKNRRDFMKTFQRSLTNYRQSDKYLCVAIIDIDFFKNYNDYYGHPQGDECLRTIGKILNSIKNNLGIYTARIGGEEFALIWFENETANVSKVPLLLNKMLRELNIPHAKSTVSPNVTVSIGIHVALCGDSPEMETLYKLADNALYTAKENGRNRAVISGVTETPVVEF